MNRSMKHAIAATALAFTALGTATGARAGNLHVSIGVSLPRAVPTQVQPVPVHMPVHPVYDEAPRGWRPARGGGGPDCRAPRWHPDARYLPGQVVRRKGGLFIARPVSARVWNVNSPPEWTPRYWAPAQCR